MGPRPTRGWSEATTMIAAVPLVLGANLWMVSVGVPLSVGLAGRGPAELAALAIALAGALLLAFGVWRRSERALLIAFPAAALLPQALWATGDRPLFAQAPWPLLVLSLLAYLIASTFALAEAEAERESESAEPGQGSPAAGVMVGDRGVKWLAPEAVPSRWRRRLRVYRGFIAAAALFPLVLLGYAMLSASVRGSLALQFGPGAARAHALLCAGTGVLWLIVLRGYLLAPLAAHLLHDRDLIAYGELARKQARRGRPRPLFYVFVLLALAAMVLTVWQRSP